MAKGKYFVGFLLTLPISTTKTKAVAAAVASPFSHRRNAPLALTPDRARRVRSGCPKDHSGESVSLHSRSRYRYGNALPLIGVALPGREGHRLRSGCGSSLQAPDDGHLASPGPPRLIHQRRSRAGVNRL